jgi:hypothetical protein
VVDVGVPDERGAWRLTVEASHGGEQRLGVRLAHRQAVPADDAAEVPQDPEPLENLDREGLALVGADAHPHSGAVQCRERVRNLRVEGGVAHRDLGVEGLVATSARRDLVVVHGRPRQRQHLRDQAGGALAQQRHHVLATNPRLAALGEHPVQGAGDVAAGVDQRAVEVEHQRVGPPGRLPAHRVVPWLGVRYQSRSAG